ncbi:MAG: hypothetical protein AAFU68_02905 [Pseudomonadota bacterium]
MSTLSPKVRIDDWRKRSEIRDGRIVSFYPDTAEKLSSIPFQNHAVKPSAFAAGRTVEDRSSSTTTCPDCSEIGPMIDHGEAMCCPKCGLEMQLFGAALYIWRTAS